MGTKTVARPQTTQDSEDVASLINTDVARYVSAEPVRHCMNAISFDSLVDLINGNAARLP